MNSSFIFSAAFPAFGNIVLPILEDSLTEDKQVISRTVFGYCLNEEPDLQTNGVSISSGEVNVACSLKQKIVEIRYTGYQNFSDIESKVDKSIRQKIYDTWEPFKYWTKAFVSRDVNISGNQTSTYQIKWLPKENHVEFNPPFNSNAYQMQAAESTKVLILNLENFMNFEISNSSTVSPNNLEIIEDGNSMGYKYGEKQIAYKRNLKIEVDNEDEGVVYFFLQGNVERVYSLPSFESVMSKEVFEANGELLEKVSWYFQEEKYRNLSLRYLKEVNSQLFYPTEGNEYCLINLDSL